MTHQVTCSQWARLVQVAEAHGIEFSVCQVPLGKPYRVDREARHIHLDPGQLLADGYFALASGLAELTHANVSVLYRAGCATRSEMETRSS